MFAPWNPGTPTHRTFHNSPPGPACYPVNAPYPMKRPPLPRLLPSSLPWPRSVFRCAQSGRVQLVDRVVAVVNDGVITRYELNEQKRAVVASSTAGRRHAAGGGTRRPGTGRFINEKVQLQYAKEYGIRADDEVVNASLQRIAAENKMSMQRFAAALRNDGVTIEKFRDELKNEIIINRVR